MVLPSPSLAPDQSTRAPEPLVLGADAAVFGFPQIEERSDNTSAQAGGRVRAVRWLHRGNLARRRRAGRWLPVTAGRNHQPSHPLRDGGHHPFIGWTAVYRGAAGQRLPSQVILAGPHRLFGLAAQPARGPLQVADPQLRPSAGSGTDLTPYWIAGRWSRLRATSGPVQVVGVAASPELACRAWPGQATDKARRRLPRPARKPRPANQPFGLRCGCGG